MIGTRDEGTIKLRVRHPVVVLVEDDQDLLDSWAELLEFLGYHVHPFVSARAALAAPDALAQADVLLTDYNLGDLNGIELIRRVRRQRPDLPAAVMTGLAGEVEGIVRQERAVALFAKPVAVDALEAYLQAWATSSGETAERSPANVRRGMLSPFGA